MPTDADKPTRAIRSFVRREGRLTPAQQRALDDYWPKYGLDYASAPLDFGALFGRNAPRVIEIGFGNGDALAHIAAANPSEDFIGIEVHRPGVGHLLRALEQRGITNVRVVCHDAVEVLRDQIADAALARVNIYFPDPWPKKRHHKRRIVQPPFLKLLATKMAPGALLHLATDWQPYAQHMLDVLGNDPYFENEANGEDLDSGCVPRPDARPLTKFELRGQRKGHGVWDLMFSRNAHAPD